MRTMKRIWRGFADVLSAKQSSENVELGNSSAVQTVDGRSQSMSPDTLMEDLVRDEGLRLELYQDSVGKWTIGVGRNLDDVGISEDEAMYLLRNDISRAKRDPLHKTGHRAFLLVGVRNSLILGAWCDVNSWIAG